MTRWHPDTCGCEVEYSDDGKFTVTAVHKKCAKHAGTASHDEHLATVFAHNRKKNAVHNAAVEHLKTIRPGLDPHSIATVYDERDNLTIHGTDVSADESVVLHAKVKDKLGRSALFIKV